MKNVVLPPKMYYQLYATADCDYITRVNKCLTSFKKINDVKDF